MAAGRGRHTVAVPRSRWRAGLSLVAVLGLAAVSVVAAAPGAQADGCTLTSISALQNKLSTGGSTVTAKLCTTITDSASAGLILAQGSHVTLDLNGNALTVAGNGYAAGIQTTGATLTIEDTSAAGDGVLTATGSSGGTPADGGGAGIGGPEGQSSGTVIVAGGTVRASGGYSAAGIGGGGGGLDGGTVTISGGTVTATGGQFGPGISDVGNADESVTISGGTVTATGGSGAAGIGGARIGGVLDGGSVTISGGTVTATGGSHGAGIGGGDGGAGGTVEIDSGATVTASGNLGADAVGAGGGGWSFGSLSNAGTLTLNGGEAVPSGTTVTNTGEIDLHGSLSGSGTVANPGMIIVGTNGSVDSATTVTDNDFAISYDLNGAPGTALDPQTIYAPTFGQGQVQLPTPSAGTGYTFTGWFTARAGGTRVADDGTNGTFLPGQFGTSPSGPTRVTLYAQWKDTTGATCSFAFGAVAAAFAQGGLVTLCRNIPGGGGLVVPTSAPVTLDLNGHELDVTGAGDTAGIQTTGATLTVEDSTGGGVLRATGDTQAAGIGGSFDGAGGTVTIDGGTVTATGGVFGAGIGGGYGGAGGTVTIDGGTVTATGGDTEAGIGGGDAGSGGAVTIGQGATVTATAGPNAPAAIGPAEFGASFGSLSNAGTLTLLGGEAVPSGTTVTNTGEIDLDSALSGQATVVNDGTIVLGSGGSVASATTVTVNDFAITYDLNDGSTITTVVYAATFAAAGRGLPPTPTWTGHTFHGWFTGSTDGTPVTDGTDGTNLVHQFGTSPTGATPVTIYAHWTADPETVTFNPENGDSTFTEPTTYGATVATPDAPTWTGHTFDGWYTAAAGGTQWEFDTDVVTGATTLYGRWTVDQEPVTFDPQDGDDTTTVTTAFGTPVTEPSPAPTRTGYAFDGWSTRADGTAGLWDFSTDIAGPTTLYAQWTANPETVKFNPENGDSTFTEATSFGATVAKPDAPTRTGYTLAGWSASADGAAGLWDFNSGIVPGALTLYAQWTADPETVTFTPGNGDSTFTEPTSYGSTVAQPTAPTRTGYTFAGWYTAATGGTLWDFATGTVTGPTTLYARWTADRETVTFTPGNGRKTFTETTGYGRTVTKPDAPTWTGRTFAGWYTAAAGGTRWNFATGTVTRARTLYGQWTRATVSRTRVAQGGRVTVSGSGFLPDERVHAVLSSGPRDLGTHRADAHGRVTVTFAIPAGFPAGRHTVTLTGTGGRHARVTLTVTRSRAH